MIADLLQLISTRADEYGDKVVFRFLDTGAEWSYGDLVLRAERVGAALAAHGVVPGQHVGILTEDRAAFCEAFFGAHAAGAVPVPLGIAGQIESDAWRTVVRDRVARFQLDAILTDLVMVATLGPVLAPTVVIGVDGTAGPRRTFVAAGSHAFIQPSSGTTGDPKGVLISHRAVLANLAAIGEHWNLGPDDIGLSWLPLFHDMGLIGTMINAIFQGGSLYHWPTASFLRSPGRWLQRYLQT